MDVGRGDLRGKDELVGHIHLAVIFGAVVGPEILLRPARVGVFVGAQFGVFREGGRDRSGFDLGVFLARVALPGHFDKGRIHNHARPGQGQAVALLKVAQERLEEPLEAARRGERGTEVRNGLAVGHEVGRGQPEKGAEAVAVGDLVGHRVIGQPVQGLEHEHFEHEERLKAGASARSLGWLRSDGGAQLRRELRPVDDFADPQQRGLEGGHVEFLQKLIEKSVLTVGNELGHAPPCPRAHGKAIRLAKISLAEFPGVP